MEEGEVLARRETYRPNLSDDISIMEPQWHCYVIGGLIALVPLVRRECRGV